MANKNLFEKKLKSVLSNHRRFIMTKKSFVVGIPALALVFGVIIVGCGTIPPQSPN